MRIHSAPPASCTTIFRTSAMPHASPCLSDVEGFHPRWKAPPPRSAARLRSQPVRLGLDALIARPDNNSALRCSSRQYSSYEQSSAGYKQGLALVQRCEEDAAHARRQQLCLGVFCLGVFCGHPPGFFHRFFRSFPDYTTGTYSLCTLRTTPQNYTTNPRTSLFLFAASDSVPARLSGGSGT